MIIGAAETKINKMDRMKMNCIALLSNKYLQYLLAALPLRVDTDWIQIHQTIANRKVYDSDERIYIQMSESHANQNSWGVISN